MIRILTTIALLLPAPAHAGCLDKGGPIARYQADIRAARGVHVISGDCMSACTMWLGYKGTCVEPDAKLWFHAAWSDWSGRPEPSPIASAIMASYYPGPLRRMVALQGWLSTPRWNVLSGREAIGLGARACGSA